MYKTLIRTKKGEKNIYFDETSKKICQNYEFEHFVLTF